MTDTTSGAPWNAPGRGHGWGRRVALAVGGIVLLLGVVAGVAISSLNSSIDRVGVGGLGEGAPDVGTAGDAESDADGDGVADVEDAPDARALTVLVLGSDTREVLTPEERNELGTGNAPGERTEVIALLRLDPDDGEVRMLSVPRDTLLERCDGTRGRVNAAYIIGEQDGRGGATCVLETLRDWLGVRIDHAAKVDFRGFVDIVDALGGVSMYIDEPMQDEDANLDLAAGCVELDGAESLAFVRARHIDNDFGRMGRQQRFMTELRNELASVGVFGSPARAFRVAEAIARSVELDDSLTLNRIQQLVRQHASTIAGDLEGKVIPGTIETIEGAAYVVADEDRAAEQVRWLMTGDDPAGERADEPGPDGTDPAGDGPTDDDGATDDHGAASGDSGDGEGAGTPGDGVAVDDGSAVERSETCR